MKDLEHADSKGLVMKSKQTAIINPACPTIAACFGMPSNASG
jgi:hypothetical protein